MRDDGDEPCTWIDCTETAEQSMTSSDGTVWSRLCQTHAAEVEEAIVSGKPRALLRAWVRAQGGAEAAVARMKPAVDATVRLGQFLQAVKDGAKIDEAIKKVRDARD